MAIIDFVVTALDEAGDRLWSSRLNPLHQSGTLAIASFAVLLITGLYLFLFYSIDDPYRSVARIDRNLVGGRWIRSLHTYAADLALVAIVVHAAKTMLAGRCFGARTRAWITGMVLLGIVLLCGWSGQVMAWDLQGQIVAIELTRLLDLLPVFSMPMGRAFDGLAAVPSSFFFMNLFLHVCLPLGLALVLWIHLSRTARPVLLPPRPLLWTLIACLAVISAAMPVALAGPADLLAMPRNVPVDLVYNFWLPATWALGPVWHASIWGVTSIAMMSVPRRWPRSRPAPAPSWVDPDHCTGCTTCYKDCPFDAITMVTRVDPGRRSEFHALVAPERCVSCGICAGSCAPMSVGPAGRTGREQMRRGHQLADAGGFAADSIAVFACAKNAVARDPRLGAIPGVGVTLVDCAGSLHTSVIDLSIRSGAAGVLVLACPPRSAPCREGGKWLHERVYNGREAELPRRVDKRRVAIAEFSRGEWPQIEAAISQLRDTVRTLPSRSAAAAAAAAPDADTLCDPGQEGDDA